MAGRSRCSFALSHTRTMAKEEAQKQSFLVDMMVHVYRAFYAPSGIPTKVPLG
jgi:hypothetical protein